MRPQRCRCGAAVHVDIVRASNAANAGRPYATCPNWRTDHGCKFFMWLDRQAPSRTSTDQGPGPATPPRPAEAGGMRGMSATHSHRAGPSSPLPHQAAAPASNPQPLSSAAAQHTPAPTAAAAAAPRLLATAPQAEQHESFAVLLVVRSSCHNSSGHPPLQMLHQRRVLDSEASCASGSSTTHCQPTESVTLLLLPAVACEPAYCTQHLSSSTGEGRLPRTPAALRSLQPPYVQLRHCAAVGGVRQALGWSGPGGLLVLDTETTGLSGRDHIHQLALLNVNTCQLLAVLLRTCPRSIGRQAAEVCGANNQQLHDPHRPTFGQVAPLIHAFITGGASLSAPSMSGSGCSSSSSTGSGSLLGVISGSGGRAVDTSSTGSSTDINSTSRAASTKPSSPAAALDLSPPQKPPGKLPRPGPASTSPSPISPAKPASSLLFPATPAAAAATLAVAAAAPAAATAASASANAAPLLVAHNGGFDARMLIGEYARRGLPVPADWRVLDTLPWARQVVGSSLPNCKQPTLRQHFGVVLPPGQVEHDAGTDVTVLGQLLPHLLKASGCASLNGVLEMQKARGGTGFVRTLGQVQACMRGAAGAAEEGGAAAEARQFTCPFCNMRVVE